MVKYSPSDFFKQLWWAFSTDSIDENAIQILCRSICKTKYPIYFFKKEKKKIVKYRIQATIAVHISTGAHKLILIVPYRDFPTCKIQKPKIPTCDHRFPQFAR